MKRLFSCFLFLLTCAEAGEPRPLLALPGKILHESKLETTPGAPWRAAKGKWELSNGAWLGAERPEDKHGAVIRLPVQLKDFIIEYEFQWQGARSTSLSINAVKDHMARINLTPKSVTIQRDDHDHEGPDKAVVFARFSAELAPGVWHKVRLEMVGDAMTGQVDDMAAWGSDALFSQMKAAPGFTVGGQSVAFRNLVIREATLNPEWDKRKAELPRPGQMVAPLAAKKGPGKGKKKVAP